MAKNQTYVSFMGSDAAAKEENEKMDTIKDRNGMDLTEAEDIKKRWQEYTEELHK